MLETYTGRETKLDTVEKISLDCLFVFEKRLTINIYTVLVLHMIGQMLTKMLTKKEQTGRQKGKKKSKSILFINVFIHLTSQSALIPM